MLFFKNLTVSEALREWVNHTQKVITQKVFMSVERMAAEPVNANMMPVAELQWAVTKPPNI